MWLSTHPFSFKRFTKMLVLAIALLYDVGACGFLYTMQRSILYQNTPREEAADRRSIFFDSEGEKIRVIVRPAREGVTYDDAVIYFGGNGESVADTALTYSNALGGKYLYFMDYRGFGGSSGEPSENAIFADALALFDLVSQKHKKVSVMGRSLGSGVACYLAANRPVEQLVLTTPYDSIEEVAVGRFPIFPISMLLKDKFDSASRVGDITAKTLVFLADKDDAIPRVRSEQLIERFPSGQAIVVILPSTDHNSIVADANYIQAIGEFLDAAN